MRLQAQAVADARSVAFVDQATLRPLDLGVEQVARLELRLQREAAQVEGVAQQEVQLGAGAFDDVRCVFRPDEDDALAGVVEGERPFQAARVGRVGQDQVAEQVRLAAQAALVLEQPGDAARAGHRHVGRRLAGPEQGHFGVDERHVGGEREGVPGVSDIEPDAERQVLAQFHLDALQFGLFAVEPGEDVVLRLHLADLDGLVEGLAEPADGEAVGEAEVPLPAHIEVVHGRRLQKDVAAVEVRVLRVAHGGAGDFQQAGAVQGARVGKA